MAFFMDIIRQYDIDGAILTSVFQVASNKLLILFISHQNMINGKMHFLFHMLNIAFTYFSFFISKSRYFICFVF